MTSQPVGHTLTPSFYSPTVIAESPHSFWGKRHSSVSAAVNSPQKVTTGDLRRYSTKLTLPFSLYSIRSQIDAR